MSFAVEHLLGGHEAKGAFDDATDGDLAAAQPGKAEVDQVDVELVVDEDVVGFEVAMDDGGIWLCRYLRMSRTAIAICFTCSGCQRWLPGQGGGLFVVLPPCKSQTGFETSPGSGECWHG